MISAQSAAETRDGFGRLATGVARTAGILTLFAGSALIIGAALGVHRIQSEPHLIIDFSSLSWVTGSRWGVETFEKLEAAEVSMTTVPVIAAPVIKAKPVSPRFPQMVKRKLAKAKPGVHLAQNHVIADAITLPSAAPIKAEAKADQNIAKLKLSTAENQAHMLLAFTMLRKQFKLAVASQLKMTTQVATAEPAETVIAVQPKKHASSRRHIVREPVTQLDIQPQVPVAHAQETSLLYHREKDALKKSSTKKSVAGYSFHSQGAPENALVNLRSDSNFEYPEIKNAYIKVESPETGPPLTHDQQNTEPPSATVPHTSNKSNLDTQLVLNTQSSGLSGILIASAGAGYSVKPRYSSGGYSRGGYSGTSTNGGTQQHGSQNTTAQPLPPPLKHTDSPVRQPEKESNVLSLDVPDRVTKGGGCDQPTFVEAFDWSAQPLLVLDTEAFTHEAEGCGWTLAKAFDYWPALAWNVKGPVGVLRRNAAHMLETLSGVKLEPQAGIIIGHLSAGWKIRLSGRAEHVLYFDSKNKLLSEDAPLLEERYFVFLNVAPGAHLVYIENPQKTAGAVGIPVLSGTVTYSDFSKMTFASLTGTILGGKTAIEGVSGLSVQALGHESEPSLTGANGEFQLKDVLAISNYPIYIEATAAKGFPHRYRVLPKDMGGSRFYFLSQEQIEGWVNQLEGGLSEESGMIIVAAPEVIQKADSGLFPSAHVLEGFGTLSPESYTLSETGKLLINKALEVTSPRFISVQVPEGPAIAELKDQSEKTVWSELVFTSPGVINLLGPY